MASSECGTGYSITFLARVKAPNDVHGLWSHTRDIRQHQNQRVRTGIRPGKWKFLERLEIGPDGKIYSARILPAQDVAVQPRHDFKEFPLPGPDPSPYALGFDADGYLWYDSHTMDIIGRLDPRTGKVIEYPVPHSELAMREFFRDSQAGCGMDRRRTTRSATFIWPARTVRPHCQ